MLAALLVAAALETPTPPAGDQWQLVWSDEFDQPHLDRSKWTVETNCWGGGNAERQCYTRHRRNIAVRDGHLVITARRERVSGAAWPTDQRRAERAQSVSRSFSSARLNSKGKASWRYGHIEVRARLPQGQGTWPAIWMLPETSDYGPWAASGEIDIVEAVNLGVPCATCPGGLENTILGTLHFGGTPPDNAKTGDEMAFPPVLQGFHTYAIEWTPERIVWLVDGRVWAERRSSQWSTSGLDVAGAPFDRPFHLLLNLAIGGRLPESRGLRGVTTTGYPREMLVDWVRVWQKPGAGLPIRGE